MLKKVDATQEKRVKLEGRSESHLSHWYKKVKDFCQHGLQKLQTALKTAGFCHPRDLDSDLSSVLMWCSIFAALVSDRSAWVALYELYDSNAETTMRKKVQALSNVTDS